MADVGAGYLFHVVIDGMDIGMWTECSGLNASYDVTDYEEGGNNRFAHKLIGRMRYGNVTLKRGVDATSAAVAAWFSSVLTQSTVRFTASITIYDRVEHDVASWHMLDVVPVKWSGPSLSSSSTNVAMEELELAHQGFFHAPGGG